MATPTAVLRFFEERHPLFQRRTVPVADRVRDDGPMSSAEMRRRAEAVWRTIDAETVAPTRESRTQAKATRLSYVARDLQQALAEKARVVTVWEVVRFLLAVMHRSRSLGYAR